MPSAYNCVGASSHSSALDKFPFGIGSLMVGRAQLCLCNGSSCQGRTKSETYTEGTWMHWVGLLELYSERRNPKQHNSFVSRLNKVVLNMQKGFICTTLLPAGSCTNTAMLMAHTANPATTNLPKRHFNAQSGSSPTATNYSESFK